MSETLLSIPSNGIVGTAAMQGYTFYTYNYTATLGQSYLTFNFRQDPAFWGLDDVSVTSGGGPNLIGNGGFKTGNLTDWTLIGQRGLPAAGHVAAGPNGNIAHLDSYSGSYYFDDGAVGGVDGIYQSFNTNVGQTYTVSFWLSDDGGAGSLAQVDVGAKTAALANYASSPSNLGLSGTVTVNSPSSVSTSNMTPTISGDADAGPVLR